MALNTELKQALDELHQAQQSKITALEKQVGDLSQSNTALAESLKEIAARRQFTRAGDDVSPEMLTYRKAINRYIRKGTEEVDGAHLLDLEKKALATNIDPDGGYLVMPDTDRGPIEKILVEVSPIRAISSIRQISGDRFEKPFNLGGHVSGWVGETEARPETETSKLSKLTFLLMELYSMPAATQRMLDDSAFDVEEWLEEEVVEDFAEQEGRAFVKGDTNSQPEGFLSVPKVANASWAWGSLGYVITGASGAFPGTNPGDVLLNLVYALKAGYRRNARWVMNSQTALEVRKFKDGNGQYLWQPSLQQGEPDRLLGYPTTIAEDMPEIAADSFSIAFGDFRRGYLVVDRPGMRVLRDSFTSKPNVLFYSTKRVGGGVQNYEAIKLLKFGTA